MVVGTTAGGTLTLFGTAPHPVLALLPTSLHPVSMDA